MQEILENDQNDSIQIKTQYVIPNSQELELSKKCGTEISEVPFCVKTFKFDKRNLDKFNSRNAFDQRNGYSSVCLSRPNSKFLLHIQVCEKSEFTDEQLNFIKIVQEIEETPFFCMYEKSYKNSIEDFKSQLEDTIESYPNKEVIPAIELYSKDSVEKIDFMKSLNIKKCIVIYRNYKRYKEEWNEVMWALDSAEIESFVFGVYPRMRRKNKASILLAPLGFGANHVSHALPWSGGKGFIYELQNNWIYGVNMKISYPLSRINALNVANSIINSTSNLSIEQIEALLYA